MMMSDVKGPWGNVTSAPDVQAYAVYAPIDGKFVAFPLVKNETAREIFSKITQNENNHATRKYDKTLEPGDIDYMRIERAASPTDAVDQAKARGFEFGPAKARPNSGWSKNEATRSTQSP
jgi:hypothetical protein